MISKRVYKGVELALKEIQVHLRVGLVPIINMEVDKGICYYSISYYEGVNFR